MNKPPPLTYANNDTDPRVLWNIGNGQTLTQVDCKGAKRNSYSMSGHIHMNTWTYNMLIHGHIPVEQTLSLQYSGDAQGMSIDDSELREYTHGLFGSMAAILKQDFQPYLSTCVAAALASCDQVS